MMGTFLHNDLYFFSNYMVAKFNVNGMPTSIIPRS